MHFMQIYKKYANIIMQKPLWSGNTFKDFFAIIFWPYTELKLAKRKQNFSQKIRRVKILRLNSEANEINQRLLATIFSTL